MGVSKLIKKNGQYYCSNCMMRQYNLNWQCCFCENEFSNWEEIQFKEYTEALAEEVKKENEGNILRRN